MDKNHEPALKKLESSILNGSYPSVLDITDWERLQELIRSKNEKIENLTLLQNNLNEIFESMPFGTLLIDRKQRIVSVNSTAIRMLGYEHENELVGQPCFGSLCLGVENQCPIWDLKKNRDTHTLKVFTRKFEQREILKSAVPIRLQDKELILECFIDISDQKRTEQALLESEKRFRSFFDIGLIGMAVTSLEQGWILTNDRLCEMLGYEQEELKEKTWTELTYSADLSEDLQHFNALLEGNLDHYSMDKRFIRRDGTIVYTKIATKVVRSESGEVLHFLTLIDDITKRKLNEIAIGESEQKYRILFEAMNEAYVLIEPILSEDGAIYDYRYLSVNPAFEQITGRKINSVIGKTLREVYSIDPQLQPEILRYISKVIHEGENITFDEYSELDKRWYRIHAFNTSPGKCAMLFSDISSEKKAQIKLEQTKNRYQGIFESSPISLWEEDFTEVKKTLDTLSALHNEGLEQYLKLHPELVWELVSKVKILSVNQATLKMFRADNSEHFLNGLQEIFSNASAESFLEEILTLYSGQYQYQTEVLQHTLDGTEIWTQVQVVIPPGFQQSWERVIVSILDLSEAKESEVKLQKVLLDLSRSNEDLEQFAYAASHDLQEPLRKIQIFGERLQMKLRAISLQDELIESGAMAFLERLILASHRAQKLIEDLLSFSRLSTRAQPAKTTDPNLLLGELADLFSHSLLECQGQLVIGELPHIHADPVQLRQLFQNLISNAIKFRSSKRKLLIQIQSKTFSNSFEIHVKDNGIGFEEKYQHKIFEIFKRLHSRSEYEGTGIGLAICKKIVQRIGGSISVYSKPDRGTVFVISFPKPIGNQDGSDE
jgi:PAS domain S-box-containing protein